MNEVQLNMMEARFKEAQKLGIQPKISAKAGLELIELARKSLNSAAGLKSQMPTRAE